MITISLTKNGEGDLVIMDMETYTQRESVLRLRETLLRSDADIKHGREYMVEETVEAMKRVIADIVDTEQ